MMQKKPYRVFTYVRWKKKDSIAVFLIIVIGLLMTSISFFFSNFYDIFISLCLGFFIGGLVLSVISTFLAQMESNISGTGELDAEVDIDIDSDIDIDADVDAEIDIDTDIDTDVDYDIEAEIDVDAVDVDGDADVDSELEIDTEGEFDSDFISTITPAPIMLLFSTAFLVYGISGLTLYYLLGVDHKFIIFFASPVISYLSVKLINFLWKILAKSRYYRISSTMNLIGIKGEVLLKVDDRGGVIKVPSNTPMKFERLHVKPLREEMVFDRGDQVYICSVKNGLLLVDNSLKSIRSKKRLN